MNVSRSHIISCCIGMLIGGAISYGLRPASSDESQKDGFVCSTEEKQSAYDLTSKDNDGDVIITPHGKKYHNSQYCPSLKRSKTIKYVRSSEAERNGYEACLKCFNP